MSCSFDDLDVPPTLVSFAVTTYNIDNVVSPEFKAAEHAVCLVKPEYNEKAKAKERFTKTNDIRIDQEVQHAFKKFHKLRWINLKEDDFTNLPELQRITRKFAD